MARQTAEAATQDLKTAISHAGLLHDPAGMTDTDIDNVVAATYTARQAIDQAGADLLDTINRTHR